MAIQFECPSCSAKLRLADEKLAGKRIKCPKCGKPTTIPKPEIEDEAVSAATDDHTATSREEPTKPAKRRLRDERYQDEDDEVDDKQQEPAEDFNDEPAPKPQVKPSKRKQQDIEEDEDIDHLPADDQEDDDVVEDVDDEELESFDDEDLIDVDEDEPGDTSKKKKKGGISPLILGGAGLVVVAGVAAALFFMGVFGPAPINNQPVRPSGPKPGLPQPPQGDPFAQQRKQKRLAAAKIERKLVDLLRKRDKLKSPLVTWLAIDGKKLQRFAFAPGGSGIAAIDAETGIHVWDLYEPTKPKSFGTHSDQPVEHLALAFSPDGSKLATAAGKSVTLWDLIQAKEIHKLDHKDWDFLTDVAFTPDGQKLVVTGKAAGKGNIQLWDVASAKSLFQFGEAKTGLQLAVSPNNKSFAVVNADGTTQLLDAQTGQPLFSYNGNQKSHAVAFAPDGKTFAIGGRSNDDTGFLHLIDEQSKQPKKIDNLEQAVSALAFSPSGNLIACLLNGKTTTGAVFDTASLTQVGTLPDLIDSSAQIAFAPGGSFVAGFGNGGIYLLETDKIAATPPPTTPPNPEQKKLAQQRKAKLLALQKVEQKVLKDLDAANLAQGDELATLTEHRKPLHAIAFAPNGRLLASASRDGTILVWDLTTAKSIKTLNMPKTHVQSVAFSPDSQFLAAAGSKLVAIWSLPDGSFVRELPHKDWVEVKFVAFTPDGSNLISAGNAGVGLAKKQVQTWDFKTGTPQQQFAPSDSPVTAISVGPYGKRLATAFVQASPVVWDLTSAKRLHAIDPPEGTFVDALAFSPDGNKLAMAGGGPFGTTISPFTQIVDLQARGALPIQGHPGTVKSIAYTPDGKALVCGYQPFRPVAVKLFDATSANALGSIPSTQASGYAVAVSPGGKMLATIHANDQIQIWNLDKLRQPPPTPKD